MIAPGSSQPRAHRAPRQAPGRPAAALRTASALLVLAAAAGAAIADEHHGRQVPMLAAYEQECGACHVPYPPRLLPQASWQRLMAGLPHHFGTDASLDPAANRAVAMWLAANAGRGDAPPQDRITQGRWFQREHREVPAAAWQRAAIRSAANCGACHPGAAQGEFDEDNVRIPR